MNEKFPAKSEREIQGSGDVFELQAKAIDGLRDVSKQIDSALERSLSAVKGDEREELERIIISLEDIRREIEVVIIANEEIMKMMGDHHTQDAR